MGPLRSLAMLVRSCRLRVARGHPLLTTVDRLAGLGLELDGSALLSSTGEFGVVYSLREGCCRWVDELGMIVTGGSDPFSRVCERDDCDRSGDRCLLILPHDAIFTGSQPSDVSGAAGAR